MVKPNVLCIGFVKCGTTTFYNIMNQHKDIFLSGIKEPVYYNKRKIYEKGFKWYQKRYYPHQTKEKIVMEVNPLIAKRVQAATIKKDYGKNVKIIIIIRNPIERLYSNFKMNLAVGRCFESIQDNLGNSTSSMFHKWLKIYYDKENKIIKKCTQTHIVASGKYYKVIKDYIDNFGKDNVKIIIFEDFVKETKKTSEEVYKFINIEDDENINYNIHSNEGNRLPINKFSIKIHNYYYYKIYNKFIIPKLPYISKSFCKCIDYINWTLLNKFFTKKNNNIEKMLPEDQKILREYYYNDVKKLSKLLDINLLKKWKME